MKDHSVQDAHRHRISHTGTGTIPIPRTNFKLATRHVKTLKIHGIRDWLKMCLPSEKSEINAEHYKRSVTQRFRVLVLH
jgi:hypothetical protein